MGTKGTEGARGTPANVRCSGDDSRIAVGISWNRIVSKGIANTDLIAFQVPEIPEVESHQAVSITYIQADEIMREYYALVEPHTSKPGQSRRSMK